MKILVIVTGILFLLIVATIGAVLWSLAPSNSADQTPQLLTVVSGASVSSVATELASRGVIRSELAFKSLAKVTGSQVEAGLYYVSPSQSPSAILQVLGEGKTSEVSVTFPEGLRREELAELLVKADLIASVSDFMAATVVSEQSPDWLTAGFGLKAGDSLEGFLFPDTYRFAAQTTPDQIVDKLLANFRKRTSDLALNYDQVKLASIVEREALFDDDRPDIAGVYTNRLSIGMKLDADPTVQYAKASNEWKALGGTCEVLAVAADSSEVKESAPSSSCATRSPKGVVWWPTLTVRDYDLTESSYNTYRNPDLPPTPISNPGLASLKAAADPAENDFFYFLHDAAGRTHFARTAEEHTQNKRQFLN